MYDPGSSSSAHRGESWQVHNMKWEEFTHEGAGNGGHELYRFLSETAVGAPGVHASVAAALRMVNKTFKQTIDPMICAYMRGLNATVAELQTAIRTDITHKELKPPRGGQGTSEEMAARFNAWSGQDAINERTTGEKTDVIERKFGYHTVMTLKKCMSEAVRATQGQGTTYGWTRTLDDVPRLGTTVHCFLAMAGKHACELHAGRKHCECSGTIGGGFAYVPNGRGLIMHCCEACIDEHSIILNPSSGTPIVPRSRKDPQNERMRELAHGILLQMGISPPYGRDSIRQQVGSDAWQLYLNNPHHMMLGRRRHLDSSSALRFLLLSHPSIDNESKTPATRALYTFQDLLHATKSNVAEAENHIFESDRLMDNLKLAQKQLLRDHAIRQFNRLLTDHGVGEGITALTLEEAGDLLPGATELIERAVVQGMLETPLPQMREAHILSSPFTMRLLSAVVLGLGQLNRYDRSFSGCNASRFAYAYATGLCAGKDIAFNIRELSAQINIDVCEPGVSLRCWRSLVTTMHVFDAIDYQSIRVVQCPQEQIMGYMRDHYGGAIPNNGVVLQWSFDVGGVHIKGPVSAPLSRKWFEDKKESGETLLAGLNYAPAFRPVPNAVHFQTLSQKAGDLDSGEHRSESDAYEKAIKACIGWFQHTAQHLCARPETRALGLDVLTGDSTRMLIKIVEEADLDPECVASSAMSLQLDEAEEDAVDSG